MYQVAYYYKETTGVEVVVSKFQCYEFRLKRNALHYVREIVQSEYREKGFGTEEIVGGIKCYKSEKTENGDRKIIEAKIIVEKAQKKVGQ